MYFLLVTTSRLPICNSQIDGKFAGSLLHYKKATTLIERVLTRERKDTIIRKA